MKKNLVWLTLLACGMTSCNPVTGILKVEKPLKVIHQQTQNCNPMGHACPDQKETVNINPGNYVIKMQLSSKKLAVISMKTASRQLSLNLNIPNGRGIPENGPFHLTSHESGQPFDFESVMTTKRSDSALQRSFEACQYEQNETVCTPQGCWVEHRIRQGARDIRYIDRTTIQKLEGSFMDPSSKEQLAVLNGDRSSVQRIIQAQGPCY